jgi:site-specific DNA-methyltransferase (adenine-specific)
LKDDAGVWIFSGWTNLVDILNSLRDNNLKLINHIIWKYQFGVFTRRKFVTSHYHVLFAVKNEKNYFFNKIEHYPEDVWHFKREYERGVKKNATKLPVDLVLRCIDFGSKPGDVIIDPFMGNGTTAIAAKGSFRHFIGFEINTSLKDVIEKGVEKTEIGQFYVPYSDRPDELVLKARKKFKKH